MTHYPSSAIKILAEAGENELAEIAPDFDTFFAQSQAWETAHSG